MTFKLVLYYDIKSAYSDKISELIQLLHSIKTRHAIEFEEISRSGMTSESEGNLKNTLYKLQLHPEGRGEIVTKRGDMLPLTKRKNLNLANTPILLIEENGKLIDVLPKRIQGHFTSVHVGLGEILENGPQLRKAAPSAESLAVSRVIKDPRIIEDGLEIIGQEVDVPAGKVDLLAKDRNHKFLLVEFEREASDGSVGQIIRLSASFAKQNKVSHGVVRKMIVCGRAYDHHREGAESVDIEVRIFPSIFGRIC
jgi:hypothetical protein